MNKIDSDIEADQEYMYVLCGIGNVSFRRQKVMIPFYKLISLNAYQVSLSKIKTVLIYCRKDLIFDMILSSSCILTLLLVVYTIISE